MKEFTFYGDSRSMKSKIIDCTIRTLCVKLSSLKPFAIDQKVKRHARHTWWCISMIRNKDGKTYDWNVFFNLIFNIMEFQGHCHRRNSCVTISKYYCGKLTASVPILKLCGLTLTLRLALLEIITGYMNKIKSYITFYVVNNIDLKTRTSVSQYQYLSQLITVIFSNQYIQYDILWYSIILRIYGCYLWPWSKQYIGLHKRAPIHQRETRVLLQWLHRV